MLAVGLDGIKNHLTVPEATDENLFAIEPSRRATLERLPGSPGEALDAPKQDTVVREALGSHVYERFAAAKRLE